MDASRPAPGAGLEPATHLVIAPNRSFRASLLPGESLHLVNHHRSRRTPLDKTSRILQRHLSLRRIVKRTPFARGKLKLSRQGGFSALSDASYEDRSKKGKRFLNDFPRPPIIFSFLHRFYFLWRIRVYQIDEKNSISQLTKIPLYRMTIFHELELTVFSHRRELYHNSVAPPVHRRWTNADRPLEPDTGVEPITECLPTVRNAFAGNGPQEDDRLPTAPNVC